MKLAPIEAAPPTLVSLPPAAAPPIRAMVAAVVTIDTVFEILLSAKTQKGINIPPEAL